jgi:hypothetical protein
MHQLYFYIYTHHFIAVQVFHGVVHEGASYYPLSSAVCNATIPTYPNITNI